MLRKHKGLATVEAAIVGLVAMITLFGVIEVARVFFVMNALEEATRRGARVAAVCQLNDPAIAEVTVFNPSGGGANSDAIMQITADLFGLPAARPRVTEATSLGAAVCAAAGCAPAITINAANTDQRITLPCMMPPQRAPSAR